MSPIIYVGGVAAAYAGGVQMGVLMPPDQIARQLGFFGDNAVVSDFPTESANAVASSATVTNLVYLDVEIGEEAAGRITIGLYGDAAPRTVENFRVRANYMLVQWETGASVTLKCIYS